MVCLPLPVDQEIPNLEVLGKELTLPLGPCHVEILFELLYLQCSNVGLFLLNPFPLFESIIQLKIRIERINGNCGNLSSKG